MSPRPTYEEVLRLRAASAKQSAEKMAAAPAAAAPANAPQPPPQPPHPPPPAAASAPAPSPPAVAPAPVAAPAKPVAEPAFTDAEVEVLRTPLAPSEWCGSELHERALAYMRSRRDAAVLADPSLAPTVEMASDLRLWRFLVATAFKGGDAASMYVEALRWRKRNGTDATRADLRAANPSFFTARATSLEMPLLNEQDAAVFAARPRTFFTKSAGGGGELLLDRAGNLLFIEVPASADAAAVCALGADAFLAAELRTQELLQLVLDELSTRQDRLVLMFRVLDLAGVSLTPNPFRSSDVKKGEGMVKSAGKEVRDAYPTTTYKNCLINAPAASIAGPIVAALVPKRSRDKTMLLGKDYAGELHSFVAPSSLPKKLGGELDNGNQWKK